MFRLAALLGFEDAQAPLVRPLPHVSCSGVGRLVVAHRLGREADDLIGIAEEIRDSPQTPARVAKNKQARKPPLQSCSWSPPRVMVDR
jgi:hypothetical protein